MIALFVFSEASAQRTFVGSTPSHAVVRNFLGISLSDSIDFIRWKLVMYPARYELSCSYGLANPGTSGHRDEKRASVLGKLQTKGNLYFLEHEDRMIALLELNADLLHLLDTEHKMLIGNGGYSFTLNSTSPQHTGQFNVRGTRQINRFPLVFEGRTPCQELSALLQLNKSDACNKMKWYVIFYTDSITGEPSYYLKGGMKYRKETMDRGKWRIDSLKNGHVIYRMDPDNGGLPVYLLKADDNLLFIIHPGGHLLVGDQNFSYTLNRRKEEYPRID